MRDANLWLDLGMVLLCLAAFAHLCCTAPQRCVWWVGPPASVATAPAPQVPASSPSLARPSGALAQATPEAAPVRWFVSVRAECPHCGCLVPSGAERCAHCEGELVWPAVPCPACSGAGRLRGS